MDQYPFEFKFYVAGVNVDDFIKLLDHAGYTEQANVCRVQFVNQMKELNNQK